MALKSNYENTVKMDKPLKMTKPVEKLVPLTILETIKITKINVYQFQT